MPIYFLIFLKYLGIIKAINTGLQDLKSQAIMKSQDFDVYNNEIGILLYQSEAEKSNEAIKPNIQI